MQVDCVLCGNLSSLEEFYQFLDRSHSPLPVSAMEAVLQPEHFCHIFLTCETSVEQSTALRQSPADLVEL